ncbi:MAG: YaiI/YqxD family protein [Rhodospirillales bacterium]|nr:YaiI/YqxD family protein [Rhodospirillales bacterium]
MWQASPMIYVDADACPVKREIYRVAERHLVSVHIVANNFIAVPRDPRVNLIVVGSELDAADDWIAQRVDRRHIVVTSDVPLAARCVKAGATVLKPNGQTFTDESIGLALATRNLMTDLRSAGAVTQGPRPFTAADRSKFLSALHEAIIRLKRI